MSWHFEHPRFLPYARSVFSRSGSSRSPSLIIEVPKPTHHLKKDAPSTDSQKQGEVHLVSSQISGALQFIPRHLHQPVSDRENASPLCHRFPIHPETFVGSAVGAFATGSRSFDCHISISGCIGLTSLSLRRSNNLPTLMK